MSRRRWHGSVAKDDDLRTGIHSGPQARTLLLKAVVPHNRLTFDEREVAAVSRVVRSGQWACGPCVAQLEQQLCRRAHVAHAIAVDSGISALRLALLALGVQPGNRVAVPAYSCVALPNAAASCGAAVAAVDVVAGRWVLDADLATRQLTDQTVSAVIAVSLFGEPADLPALRSLSVPLIEDCAHAFGRVVNGQALGSRADVSILSFHATKLIGAGEGGAVLTDSAEIAHFVRHARDYADKPLDGQRLNHKMSEFEAAVALCQLNRLDEHLEARQQLAQRYNALLGPAAEDSGTFRVPQLTPNRVWYRYPIEVCATSARQLVDRLNDLGIHCAEPVSDWRNGVSGQGCLVADLAYRNLVSLPIYPTLTSDEQDRVVAGLLQTLVPHVHTIHQVA